METTLLILTGTLTTLLAGVFFGYSVSVNGALRRLNDKEYVYTMQAINIVIQNPLFFLSFIGPVFLLPLVTFLSYGDSMLTFSLLLASSIIYIIGVFGITVAGNVPLNEQLAKATDSEASAARRLFETRWVQLHTIRTVFAILVTVLYFIACCI
jgi:uncharacterized membrane protein